MSVAERAATACSPPSWTTAVEVVCQVPQTCYRTVTEPRSMVCKNYTCEPVFTEKCVPVCTGDWHVEIKAKPALDLAVQSIVFQPGSHSGWHSHPGPVFILVKTGEMTFYESHDPDGQPIRRTAGEGFLDVGDHAHIARNETDQPAENIVTYLAPPGATLRKDEPAPGNCPF